MGSNHEPNQKRRHLILYRHDNAWQMEMCEKERSRRIANLVNITRRGGIPKEAFRVCLFPEKDGRTGNAQSARQPSFDFLPSHQDFSHCMH